MDDNSNSFTSSVALRGVTSIGAGQSIIFLEGNASGSTDASIAAAFNAVWGTSFVFGSAIGAYGGSGVGLSTSGDAVNIFKADGTPVTGVSFGASPLAPTLPSFDNRAGLSSTISQLSVAGVNGAFAITDSFGNAEIGSPGAVPEPGTYAMVLAGLAVLGAANRRRKA
jgi:hypothetical protein